MPISLRRDEQRWVFDYVLQETGRPMHFQGSGRGGYPPSVHQHDMVSKHYARWAARVERLAMEEEQAHHRATALELYFDAAVLWGQAQHPVFENNDTKRFLHGSSLRCYEHVRELAPSTIEHLEIPWGDRQVYANFHPLPDGRRAPVVIFLPGCDMTKEMYPHPATNQAHQRGMHLLSLDGPGQGECNLNGVTLTDDNYEKAVGAVIDYLLTRPEVDPDGITIFGLSFASFWAIRSGIDPRVKAVAAPWASIGDKAMIMNRESPRWKMLFAYLTQAQSEDALDEMTGRMTVHEQLPQLSCPTLLTVGEYDPRSPLEEVLDLYQKMNCERELWVFEDQHHPNSIAGHKGSFDTMIWAADVFLWAYDWLRDRLDGLPVRHPGAVVYLEPGKGGPYGDTARLGGSWIDGLRNSLSIRES